MIVNSILEGVFGFDSERKWVTNVRGEVNGFPVRILIDVARKNGMVYSGYEKIGNVIIHRYVMNGVFVEVKEYIGERLVLSFEYGDDKVILVENL